MKVAKDITQFTESSTFIQENILSLQVPVKDFLRMHVSHGHSDLQKPLQEKNNSQRNATLCFRLKL